MTVDQLVQRVLETEISYKTTQGHSYSIGSDVVLLVQRKSSNRCGLCDRERPVIIIQRVAENPRSPGAAIVVFKQLAKRMEGKYCLWLQSAIMPEERQVAKAMGMTKRVDSSVDSPVDSPGCWDLCL